MSAPPDFKRLLAAEAQARAAERDEPEEAEGGEIDEDWQGAQAEPYVVETGTTKSLHFSFTATQSRMDLRHPEHLSLAYTRTMMGFLLFMPAPAAVAMIGLGGGSLARFIHRHLPEASMKVVEINPSVIDLRTEFQVPDDGERFKVRLGDGAAFVQDPPRRYDVLLVDGFDVQGQPPELASLDFYLDCRSTLEPDGVLVVNLFPGFAGFERQVENLGIAFAGQLLLVRDRECHSCVAFAARTPLAHLFQAEVLARSPLADQAAWEHLWPSLKRIARQFRLAQRTG